MPSTLTPKDDQASTTHDGFTEEWNEKLGMPTRKDEDRNTGEGNNSTDQDSQDGVAENSGNSISPPHAEAHQESASPKIPYTQDAKGSTKFSIKNFKNKKAGAGIIALLLTVIIGAFMMGPFQFIHLSHLLSDFHFGRQNGLTELRFRQMIRYMRNPDAPEKTRLGTFANKAANKVTKELAKKGIKPSYTKAGAYSNGFEIDTDVMKKDSELGSLVVDGDPEKTKANIAERFGGKFETINGKELLVPDNNDFYKNKKFTGMIVKISGVGGKIGFMKTRILNIRGGLNGPFHPFKQRAASAIDKRLESKWGSKKDGTSDSTLVADNNTDEDGNKTPPTTEQSEITDNANTVREEAKNGKFKNTLGLLGSNKLSAGLAIVSITGLTCLLDSLVNTIYDSQVENVITPIMDAGMKAISIGSQLEASFASGMLTGDFDMGTLNEYAKNLYSKDSGSWYNAKSIQTNLGNPDAGVNLPAEAAINTKDNAAIKLFENLRDASVLGAGGAIGTICNPVMQGASAVGSIVVAVFTGGSSVGARAVVFAEQIGKAITGMVAQGIALGQIEKAIVNAIINADDYFGGEWGAIIDTGAFLASNEAYLHSAARLLTPVETNQLAIIEQQISIQEKQEMSIYDKYLNIASYKSIASNMIDKNGVGTNGIANIPNVLTSTIATTTTNLGSIFSGRSHAATATGYATYNYGVNYAGFSNDEIASTITENPEANVEYVIDNNLLEKTVPDIGGTYKELFARCNNLDVNADLTSKPLNPNAATQYQSSEATGKKGIQTLTEKGECGKNKDDDLLRLRFALFDTQTAAAAACYYGDAEACAEIGIDAANGDDPTGVGDGVKGSSEYTDNLTDIIKDGEKAAGAALSFVKNNPTCGGSCKNRCLGMVTKIWQKAGGGGVALGYDADTGYKRYKEKGWVHDGDDKYNVPVGAVMWSGKTQAGGHAYIYIGNGKIVSTDLNCDTRICVSPAADIEKKWNHKYLGWSDPHKEWGN